MSLSGDALANILMQALQKNPTVLTSMIAARATWTVMSISLLDKQGNVALTLTNEKLSWIESKKNAINSKFRIYAFIHFPFDDAFRVCLFPIVSCTPMRKGD